MTTTFSAVPMLFSVLSSSLDNNDDFVTQLRNHLNQIETTDIVAWNIGETLRGTYPEVEKVAIVSPPSSVVFQKAEAAYRERGLFAQPDFFNIFSCFFINFDL